MTDEMKINLDAFANDIARRADDLYNNPSLASARMKAVLACLLNDGVREFLDRGVAPDEIKAAIISAESNTGDVRNNA